MNLVVPLSLTVSDGAVQVPPERVVFCSKCHPVEGEGQETTAVFVGVWKIVKVGAPVVCTANKAQNPPLSE